MAESQTTREKKVRMRAVERNKLLKKATQKTYIKPEDWGTPQVEEVSSLENEAPATAEVDNTELINTEEQREQIRKRQEADKARVEAETSAEEAEAAAHEGEETSPEDVSTSEERKGE